MENVPSLSQLPPNFIKLSTTKKKSPATMVLNSSSRKRPQIHLKNMWRHTRRSCFCGLAAFHPRPWETRLKNFRMIHLEVHLGQLLRGGSGTETPDLLLTRCLIRDQDTSRAWRFPSVMNSWAEITYHFGWPIVTLGGWLRSYIW